jgi:hypothetical protein
MATVKPHKVRINSDCVSRIGWPEFQVFLQFISLSLRYLAQNRLTLRWALLRPFVSGEKFNQCWNPLHHLSSLALEFKPPYSLSSHHPSVLPLLSLVPASGAEDSDASAPPLPTRSEEVKTGLFNSTASLNTSLHQTEPASPVSVGQSLGKGPDTLRTQTS